MNTVETVKKFEQAQTLVLLARNLLTQVDNEAAGALNEMADKLQRDIDLVLDEEHYREPSVYGANG